MTELQAYDQTGTLVDTATFGLGGIRVYSTGRARMVLEVLAGEMTKRGITDPDVIVESLDGVWYGGLDLFAPGAVDTLEADHTGTDLKAYWTVGKGAAKIRWKTAGDFKRCVRHLGKHVDNPEGLCNTYHVAAVGAPPGKGH